MERRTWLAGMLGTLGALFIPSSTTSAAVILTGQGKTLRSWQHIQNLLQKVSGGHHRIFIYPTVLYK